MSFATMTPTQALIIRNARANSSADERKQIKREVFASAKARFGIPQEHKLKVEEQPGATDYLVLKDRNGRKYELASDGLWVNAVRAAPVAPAVVDPHRWFKVSASAIVSDVTDGDFDDGLEGQPLGQQLSIDGHDFVAGTDGALYIYLGESKF